MKRDVALLNVIGKNVKYHRDISKISQERLAQLSNCHRNYIARVESAQVDLSVSGLVQIAKGLKVDVCELLKK